MNLIDRIAKRLGYVKAPLPQPALAQTYSKEVEGVSPVSVCLAPQPGDFGLPEDVTFVVQRGSLKAASPVSWNDVVDFLDACGVDVSTLSGEATFTGILSGIPIHVDGADVSFKLIF